MKQRTIEASPDNFKNGVNEVLNDGCSKYACCWNSNSLEERVWKINHTYSRIMINCRGKLVADIDPFTPIVRARSITYCENYSSMSYTWYGIIFSNLGKYIKRAKGMIEIIMSFHRTGYTHPTNIGTDHLLYHTSIIFECPDDIQMLVDDAKPLQYRLA